MASCACELVVQVDEWDELHMGAKLDLKLGADVHVAERKAVAFVTVFPY